MKTFASIASGAEKRMRDHYRSLLGGDLQSNQTLPPLLRAIGLHRPLRRLVDRWALAATIAHTPEASPWRVVAAQVSMILHAVYVAVTRGLYDRLKAPANWAETLLREQQVPQLHGTRAVRERAVRDRLAQYLATNGLDEGVPRYVVQTWGSLFPEELSLYEDYVDLETHMREHIERDGTSRFEQMLGDDSVDAYRDTGIAPVRLMLRHPMWSINTSKNYLKADIVTSARAVRRKQREARKTST